MSMTGQQLISAICQSCGDCCRHLPAGAYFTPTDLARLVEWAGIADKLETALERLGRFLVVPEKKNPAAMALAELDELDPTTGHTPGEEYCSAMSCQGVNYRCSIYEARPDMCRHWNCNLIWDLISYLENPAGVSEQNMFRGAGGRDAQAQLVEIALANTPFAKGNYPNVNFKARFQRRMGSW